MTDIHDDLILILDFGSQYTQLIARVIREAGVYCEIHPCSVTDAFIRSKAPQGIILSGGPDSVTAHLTPRAPNSVFELNCPVLGICYGMQTMAEQLGGKVSQGQKREFGYAEALQDSPSLLLKNLDSRLDVWMSHGDHVTQLPPSFTRTVKTNNCEIAGMSDEARQFYGLQFHPEVSHTKNGHLMLKQFVLTICKCKPSWTMKNIIEEQIALIKNKVKNEKVILGLSGGVDSSVAAILLHKALGDQLTCIFVDTGLLRLNEKEEVKKSFETYFKLPLICVDAEKDFYAALKGISDPEEKRKIIGKKFIDVFEQEAKKIKNMAWLAQGTIYSDVIESAKTQTGQGNVIKSHHNVGGLPEKMNLKLLEPLRELFKDEVRKLGLELGLSYDLLHRHPFPGAGLGIRVLGEVKKEYVEKLKLADAILIDELMQSNLYHQVSQAFAVFLPVKSVGVLGDARHYDHVIAIRLVESIDFMTADWAKVPYDFLSKISNRIINEVPGISRVTYDISSKPPATIEWE